VRRGQVITLGDLEWSDHIGRFRVEAAWWVVTAGVSGAAMMPLAVKGGGGWGGDTGKTMRRSCWRWGGGAVRN
jgi:hypothetical protein